MESFFPTLHEISDRPHTFFSHSYILKKFYFYKHSKFQSSLIYHRFNLSSISKLLPVPCLVLTQPGNLCGKDRECGWLPFIGFLFYFSSHTHCIASNPAWVEAQRRTRRQDPNKLPFTDSTLTCHWRVLQMNKANTSSRAQVANTRPIGQIELSTFFYPAWHLVSSQWQRRTPCP